MDDLQAAISKAELAASATPEDHPDKALVLINISNMLSDRYKRTGNIDDLQLAISKAEPVVSIIPEGRPDRAGQLNILASFLSDRYKRTGNLDDLQTAISKMELVTSTTPDDHPNRAGQLNNLANFLSDRYKRTGNVDDLQAAISKAELAVSTTPEDHPDRAERLDSLANFLSDRYKRTGNMDDLQAAISKAELAVSITPEDHPDRAELLDSLANQLSNRYTQTGNMDDLQTAISKAELAVSTTPVDHPYRVGRLNSLANHLSDRYSRTGNLDDLQAAVSKAELVVYTTPEDHPERLGRLNSLASFLSHRSNLTGNMYDLQTAISIAELVVSDTPENHPDLAGRLNNSASFLSYRFYRTGNRDDLQAAISKAQLAVSATPEDHPDKAISLFNLSNMLLDRHKRTGKIDDLQTALGSLMDSFDLPSALPFVRLRGARNALRILVSTKKWDQASSLAQAAIKILPLVCDRYLSREDQQYAILEISGLASDACSLSIKVGHVQQGLEQLEFGRGIILGYLMDGRSDLTKLQKDHPHLANEYDALRFRAYTDIEEKEPVIRAQLLKERREAATRLEACLHRVRLESGYERFLLGPTVDELQRSASEGPIVIVNATDIGCDAIIVSTSKVHAIPLPEMDSSQAPPFFQKKLGRYRAMNHQQWRKFERDIEDDTWGAGFEQMSWLWLCCVKPILKELKGIQASDSHELPRVWWIGTGIASSFPFHAAGQYNKELESYQDSENTLSQIIPSYTPTIKALSYARACATRAATTNRKEPSILIVTMPTTPRHISLPGVDHEKLAIQQMSKDFCRIKVLKSPTVEQVLEDITGFDIAHFACHGSVDPEDPSNSHLLLQKSGPSGLEVDELTVSQISKRNTVGQTWIAYLSACSTAGVETKSLADECLHLASGFQVAGFAHVIGSLWRANDDICVLLAKSFYCSLAKLGIKRSNRAVAEALRNAILEIRSEFQDPELWALFIHSGA